MESEKSADGIVLAGIAWYPIPIMSGRPESGSMIKSLSNLDKVESQKLILTKQYQPRLDGAKRNFKLSCPWCNKPVRRLIRISQPALLGIRNRPVRQRMQGGVRGWSRKTPLYSIILE